MYNMDPFIFLILETIFIIIVGISEIPLLKRYIQTKNTLYAFLILFLISNQLWALIHILNDFNYFLIIFGESLTISNISWLFMVIFIGQFAFYIKGYKKYYTLPIVASFFIASALMMINSLLTIMLFSAIFGIFCSVLLIKEGLTNKNGLPITMGIHILFIGFGNLFSILLNNPSFLFITANIGIIIFSIGAWDLVNKYLLVNPEEEQKIKNVWIARLVGDKT